MSTSGVDLPVTDLQGFEKSCGISGASWFGEMRNVLLFPGLRWFGGLLAFCSLILLGLSTVFKSNQMRFQTIDVPKVVTMKDLDDMINYESRTSVQTRTDWNAPIMWEGMWEPLEYDRIHAENQSSVALTVFAVGKYLEAYLEKFLISAEKHFMIGLPVMYYVFTDQTDKVPMIDLGSQRYIRIVKVERHSRWQDISMMRMKTISKLIVSEVQYLFPYIFCFDVDQIFTGRFGSEALGESVALLHADFYKLPKNRFTYDRNPKSKAFLETGDYYYHAAIFGGTWQNVKMIADECLASIMEDKKNNVEALWHDESHLNKYFWLHKPSKLLSPEYCWDPNLNKQDIIVTRLIWAPKDYEHLRVRLRR